MMLGSEKIKFKDYHTFTETEVSSDGSRPLEWRRSLKSIRIEANSFVVDQIHWVNECDTLTGIIRIDDASRDNDASIKETIKSDVKQKLSITSKVSFDSIKDSIYLTVVDDEDEKIFSLLEADGEIILTLSEGSDKTESWGVFSGGAYYGSTYIDRDTGNLYIYATVDTLIIENLVKEVREERIDKIILDIVLDTFSFEVDDALSDFHHKRDLFIHGFSTPAAVQSLLIRGKSFSSTPQLAPVSQPDDGDSQAHLSVKPVLSSFVVDTSQLKHIKNALWLISFLLFLIFVKN